MYCPRSFDIVEEVADATSDGLSTTALPAEIAAMTGSSDNTLAENSSHMRKITKAIYQYHTWHRKILNLKKRQTYAG